MSIKLDDIRYLPDATNGLTLENGYYKLGGTLTETLAFTLGDYACTFTQTGTGDVIFDQTGGTGQVIIKASTNDGSTKPLQVNDSDSAEVFSVDSNGHLVTASTTVVTNLNADTVDGSHAASFAASSHNHAATDINSGTLVHERGGLEADVSAYSGLVQIASGATSAVTCTTFAKTVLDDTDAATARATLGANSATNITTGSLKHEYGGLEADVSAYSGLVKIASGSTSACSPANGLTFSGSNIQFGGTMVADVTISQSNYDINFDIGGTGHIEVTDGGYSRFYFGNNGEMGIQDSTPSEALDCAETVRANAYIEFSSVYTGNDALAKICGIRALENSDRGDGWADVDHDTLPDGIRHISKKRMWREKGTDKPPQRRDDIVLNMVKNGVGDPRKKLKEDYDEVIVDIPGRNIGNMLQLLTKAVQELAERIEALESK